MYQVLKEKIYTARKEYDCDGAEWLTCDDFMSNPESYDVSFTDMRILVKIRRENYKILRGTKYIYQVALYDGEFQVTRSRIDVADICKKYDLYNI